MEVLISILHDVSLMGKIGFVSFVFGLIGLAMDYAIRPKPLNKSPLFSNPTPNISFFGIIGILSLGVSFLCGAYWAYLDPKSASGSKKTFGKMIEALGGEYGAALTSGLMGTWLVFFGLHSIYKLLVKNTKK
jgi:sugar phosphate permease